jgi:ferredoxin--NADP+ reductase
MRIECSLALRCNVRRLNSHRSPYQVRNATQESVGTETVSGHKAAPPAPVRARDNYLHARVLSVWHWNDKLFSLRVSRDAGFRFLNGHFVMLGLPIDGKPCMRAYSIASPNYEEYLEFFSIKIEDGKLTSRLQHVQEGDEVLLSRKSVGTLVIDDLKPGRRLFLFATGTGLAPFLSIVQDLETYERFDQIIVVHGVRRVVDLAYREFLTETLPANPYLGDMVSAQLCYLPTVTREPFPLQRRIPEMISDGSLCRELGAPPLDPATDRAMICGSMAMLKDTQAALDALGFAASPQQGVPGDYVIERAFVG